VAVVANRGYPRRSPRVRRRRGDYSWAFAARCDLCSVRAARRAHVERVAALRRWLVRYRCGTMDGWSSTVGIGPGVVRRQQRRSGRDPPSAPEIRHTRGTGTPTARTCSHTNAGLSASHAERGLVRRCQAARPRGPAAPAARPGRTAVAGCLRAGQSAATSKRTGLSLSWPSDSTVIEGAATLGTVDAYARRDRACVAIAQQRSSRPPRSDKVLGHKRNRQLGGAPHDCMGDVGVAPDKRQRRFGGRSHPPISAAPRPSVA
jgi:hypothetical protein